MNHGTLKTILVACILMMAPSLATADETKPAAPLAAPAKPAETSAIPAKKAKRPAKTSSKTAPKAKASTKKTKGSTSLNVVELNTASKDQLKTLPGVTDEYADKIIAGRPYLSKSNLVTNHVLPEAFYANLRRLVYVVPPAAKK